METLVLFAKAPIAGSTKTRLARERGDRDAVLLSAGFLLDTVELCARWRCERTAVDQNRRVVLYASPHVEDPLLAEAARRAGARLEVQQGADLGARLRHAFEAEYERGARAVCAIGADSPSLPLHLLDEAFRALAWERVVIGPTFDGGYWLIGAQRPAPDLFTDVPWSTPAVVPRTVNRLRATGIEPHLLPFWYDIDEAADLERLVWHAGSVRARSPEKLSATWQALERIGLAGTKAGR
jgi:rSAM/selenodomain-associated transferase 1